MTDLDETTALIYTALEASFPDGLGAMAQAVRDRLAREGLLRDGEEVHTVRHVLDLEDVRKTLRNAVERMALAEHEKWKALGAAEERRLWLEGKGNA